MAGTARADGKVAAKCFCPVAAGQRGEHSTAMARETSVTGCSVCLCACVWVSLCVFARARACVCVCVCALPSRNGDQSTIWLQDSARNSAAEPRGCQAVPWQDQTPRGASILASPPSFSPMKARSAVISAQAPSASGGTRSSARASQRKRGSMAGTCGLSQSMQAAALV